MLTMVGQDWKPAEVKKEPVKENKGKENKLPEKEKTEDGEKSGRCYQQDGNKVYYRCRM